MVLLDCFCERSRDRLQHPWIKAELLVFNGERLQICKLPVTCDLEKSLHPDICNRVVVDPQALQGRSAPLLSASARAMIPSSSNLL